jgi:hypothetical protein
MYEVGVVSTPTEKIGSVHPVSVNRTTRCAAYSYIQTTVCLLYSAKGRLELIAGTSDSSARSSRSQSEIIVFSLAAPQIFVTSTKNKKVKDLKGICILCYTSILHTVSCFKKIHKTRIKIRIA